MSVITLSVSGTNLNLTAGNHTNLFTIDTPTLAEYKPLLTTFKQLVKQRKAEGVKIRIYGLNESLAHHLKMIPFASDDVIEIQRIYDEVKPKVFRLDSEIYEPTNPENKNNAVLDELSKISNKISKMYYNDKPISQFNKFINSLNAFNDLLMYLSERTKEVTLRF